MKRDEPNKYVRVWFGAITNYGWLANKGSKLMIDSRVHNEGGSVDLRGVPKSDIEPCSEYPNHGF